MTSREEGRGPRVERSVGTPRAPLVPGAAPPRHRLAAAMAGVGAVVVAVGATLTWYRIEIAGVSGPGGTATGFEGRDGLTVAVAAGVALLAAAAVGLGRRDLWCKALLLGAGGVTLVIAGAGIVDASAKAENLGREFGVPEGQVEAEIGTGLWLTALGGLTELVAGTLVQRPGRQSLAARERVRAVADAVPRRR